VIAALLLAGQYAGPPYRPWIEWTNPVADVAGNPLSPSEILGATIEAGTCDGADFGLTLKRFRIAGPGDRARARYLPPGLYCYRVATQTAAGLSDWSLVAQFVVPETPCAEACH
jgi:hypothetical protein